MRIWRIEAGIWKTERKLSFKDYLELSFDPGICGCYLLTVSRFYLTFLGNECYHNPPSNEEL